MAVQGDDRVPCGFWGWPQSPSHKFEFILSALRGALSCRLLCSYTVQDSQAGKSILNESCPRLILVFEARSVAVSEYYLNRNVQM